MCIQARKHCLYPYTCAYTYVKCMHICRGSAVFRFARMFDSNVMPMIIFANLWTMRLVCHLYVPRFDTTANKQWKKHLMIRFAIWLFILSSKTFWIKTKSPARERTCVCVWVHNYHHHHHCRSGFSFTENISRVYELYWNFSYAIRLSVCVYAVDAWSKSSVAWCHRIPPLNHTA